VSTRSLKNKLKKVEATLPPPPPPYEELPIEGWVEEEVRSAFPQSTLENTTDEEHFFAWLEELPLNLERRISIMVVEARNEAWTIYDPIPPLPDDVYWRVVDALPQHILEQRRLWADNFPAREDRRRWSAEMERRYRSGPKTRTNGYEWWFKAQENYARLREKYSGFEEEWARFYEEWQEKCKREGRNAPMDDQMLDAFIRICFLREDHDEEAAAEKS
jgi:hypothetical protein